MSLLDFKITIEHQNNKKYKVISQKYGHKKIFEWKPQTLKWKYILDDDWCENPK